MGVWIETACGNLYSLAPAVTPFVGVWIETLALSDGATGRKVTPFVGVWIETRPPRHPCEALL